MKYILDKFMIAFSLLGMLSVMLASPSTVAQVRLPVLGDSLSGTMTTQQEYEFGREILRSMRRETRTLNDPLIKEYIANLTYKLASQSELTDFRLEFLLVDSETLNAFAAPGGIIGVNAGLFTYGENEGQFASVLAHELAHLSQRHYVRNVQEAQNNSIPNLAATLASLILMATVGGDAGTAALATTQAISIENQLRYSRDNEQEADRVGIRTLYNAGFDPRDMTGMFERMLREQTYSASRMPEFLSTHPLSQNRIADSRNRASTYPPVDYVEDIEFLLMQQRVLNHYSDNPAARISTLERQLNQRGGQKADAARYGIALAQLETGQFVTATETLAALLAKDPNRITYVMLEADIAKAAGDFEKALTILERNLGINPGNHPLTMAYAATLEEAGRYADAARVLENHSQRVPNDVDLWYQLAELQGRAGNITGVHRARAEYYLAIGEFGRARDQLNLALDRESNNLVVARIRQRLEDIRRIGDRFYR